MDNAYSFGSRRRPGTGTAVLCLLLVLAATGVQVMHHCADLELIPGQHSGGKSLPGPGVCVICMTVQVATLAVAAAVIAVSRLASLEPPLGPGLAPQTAACFALYVRPPPAF